MLNKGKNNETTILGKSVFRDNRKIRGHSQIQPTCNWTTKFTENIGGNIEANGRPNEQEILRKVNDVLQFFTFRWSLSKTCNSSPFLLSENKIIAVMRWNKNSAFQIIFLYFHVTYSCLPLCFWTSRRHFLAIFLV